jgi:hypothetical protein
VVKGMDEFTKVVNEVQNDDFVGGDVQDNTIEFLRNAKIAVATFSQGKFISRMRKLKEQFPDDVEIEEVKNSAAIVCRFPTKWIKINVGGCGNHREVTEEEKEILRERIKIAQAARKSKQE